MKIISLSFAFLFCTALRAQTLYPKALVTSEDVRAAIDFEEVLKKNYEKPATKGTPWFLYLGGGGKVLVLAPHATSQIREGHVKQADGGTGSLAFMLNNLADAPVLFTSFQSPSDPNYYDNNEFKLKVTKLVFRLKPILVLDLHGSNGARPYDIDFGTQNGQSLLGRKDFLIGLHDFLSREGFLNFSQDYFAADKNSTDTKWVSKMDVPAMQLEINSNWLSPEEDQAHAQKFAQVLEGLVRFVKFVNKGEAD